MSEKPKPCPWCLNPVKVEGVSPGCWVTCRNAECLVRPQMHGGFKRSEAIRRWNTRQGEGR